MTADHWIDVAATDQLDPGQSTLVKTETHRVAVFRTDEGHLRAVDNACPHEGYPLVQGDVRGEVLTCAWHNFKFDLRTGACLKGSEDVMAYPVRESDGQIQVNLLPPDRAEILRRSQSSLDEALREGQMGRAAREIVRAMQAGRSAAQLLADAAAFDGRASEYGTTHALPVACDLLPYLNGDLEHDALVVLTAMELASEPNLRRDDHVLPQPRIAADFSQELHEAVEAEEVETAVALVRGAMGRGPEELQAALLRVAADHFLGFGHPMIYTVKGFDLLEQAGPEAAEAILCGLVRRTINSTREDLLPPMRKLREHLTTLESDLQTAWSNRDRPATREPIGAWVARVLDPSDQTILNDFTQLVCDASRWDDALDILSASASRRLARFDPNIHHDPTHQDNWLFATHLLTFVNALRQAIARADHPSVLRGLFFGLEFIRRSHRLDGPDRSSPVATRADDLVPALDARDSDRAVAALLAWAQSPEQDLESQLRPWLLAGPATRPIFLAHLIKTTRAAFEEFERIADSEHRADPLIALGRYLGSPMGERDLASRVHDAVGLVVHGKLPKRLAI